MMTFLPTADGFVCPSLNGTYHVDDAERVLSLTGPEIEDYTKHVKGEKKEDEDMLETDSCRHMRCLSICCEPSLSHIKHDVLPHMGRLHSSGAVPFSGSDTSMVRLLVKFQPSLHLLFLGQVFYSLTCMGLLKRIPLSHVCPRSIPNFTPMCVVCAHFPS